MKKKILIAVMALVCAFSCSMYFTGCLGDIFGWIPDTEQGGQGGCNCGENGGGDKDPDGNEGGEGNEKDPDEGNGNEGGDKNPDEGGEGNEKDPDEGGGSVTDPDENPDKNEENGGQETGGGEDTPTGE